MYASGTSRSRCHRKTSFVDGRFVTSSATSTFRFFEAEEVQVAVFVAGDDDLESIGECAATRSVITGEGDQACAAIYLPTLPAYCQTTQITRQSK